MRRFTDCAALALALPLMATSSVNVSVPDFGAVNESIATPRPPPLPYSATGVEPGTGNVAKFAGTGGAGGVNGWPGAGAATGAGAVSAFGTIHARPSFSTPLSTP